MYTIAGRNLLLQLGRGKSRWTLVFTEVTVGRKMRGSRQECADEPGVPKIAKPTIAPEGASRQEAAEYIAAMLVSLRLLAHETRWPFLVYLLGIALEEANSEKTKTD